MTVKGEHNGDKAVRAALIIIGDEILSGRTKDANLSYLAIWLNERGILLDEACIIPDVHERIVSVLRDYRARFDYVFTTGGIGPTHDDITAEAVAAAFDVPLDFHPEAVKRLEAHYPPGEFTDARKRMARVPKGGVLIDNPISIAPGFQVENVFVLAGVPQIMRTMLDSVSHRLTGGLPMMSKTLDVALPESTLAEQLGQIARDNPAVQIGSYPYYVNGRVGLHVVMRSTDDKKLTHVRDAVAHAVRSYGIEPSEPQPVGQNESE